ncbi:hypothetical protein KFL_000230400 [Klebsormidium nitens]|uniref:Uncharacterized protein n=1 Tax=Klebsormidium nitens TaxID=105231 RepID=A0A1Y1HMX2_KLENI|nr:hypothetical protein KFL_000230400 [Klebsormidium nitens]|eukprot:GAQ79062.1 hypothetical protein KFL_000230400 [Klebsormidium nitens]
MHLQDPGIRRLSSLEHQWAHDDIESATLRANLEAMSSFNYSERHEEAPKAQPVVKLQSSRATRSAPSHTPDRMPQSLARTRSLGLLPPLPGKASNKHQEHQE